MTTNKTTTRASGWRQEEEVTTVKSVARATGSLALYLLGAFALVVVREPLLHIEWAGLTQEAIAHARGVTFAAAVTIAIAFWALPSLTRRP